MGTLPLPPAIPLASDVSSFEGNVLEDAPWGVFIWGGGCFILPTRRRWSIEEAGQIKLGGRLWALSYHFSTAGKRAFLTVLHRASGLESGGAC